MIIDLSEKVIVITGATKGLGRKIALSLAKNGACVVANYRSDDDTAKEFLKELCKYNEKSIVYKADVSDELQVKKLYKVTKENYGRIDVLINNAGSCDDSYIQFMTYNQWDKVMKNNLYSAFLCSRIMSKALIKNSGGKINNSASLKGQLGSEGQCNYSASKAGMIGLTKSLAKEFGPYKISVNAICPGFAVTDLNRNNSNKVNYALEMSTLSTAYAIDDLVNFITFFCSDLVKGISGRVFNLDSRIN